MLLPLNAMPPLDNIIVAEAFAKGGDWRSMSFVSEEILPYCEIMYKVEGHGLLVTIFTNSVVCARACEISL